MPIRFCCSRSMGAGSHARRAGCEVVFLLHPISDDPNDQLLLQIQGAIAEYERAVLADRFRRGKLQKAREGHAVHARAPYGYRFVPRHDGVPARLVIDEAEVVRQAYAWFIEDRLSLRQLLRRLNFGPWYPRSGRRPWSASTISCPTRSIPARPTPTATNTSRRRSQGPVHRTAPPGTAVASSRRSSGSRSQCRLWSIRTPGIAPRISSPGTPGWRSGTMRSTITCCAA
jgi:hypothetical protein